MRAAREAPPQPNPSAGRGLRAPRGAASRRASGRPPGAPRSRPGSARGRSDDEGRPGIDGRAPEEIARSRRASSAAISSSTSAASSVTPLRGRGANHGAPRAPDGRPSSRPAAAAISSGEGGLPRSAVTASAAASTVAASSRPVRDTCTEQTHGAPPASRRPRTAPRSSRKPCLGSGRTPGVPRAGRPPRPARVPRAPTGPRSAVRAPDSIGIRRSTSAARASESPPAARMASASAGSGIEAESDRVTVGNHRRREPLEQPTPPPEAVGPPPEPS